MTRLVLHVGAEYVDAGAIHRELVAWREPLQTAGVLLPPGDDPVEWREIGLGLLRSKPPTASIDLLRMTRESGANTLLLSSDTLADALTSPEEVATLAEISRANGFDDVRVVVVVREQIGYINALYCRRVLVLETARSFAEFATTSIPAHRFDYVASFGAIADTDGVELVAVPYLDLARKGDGRSVLDAAGLPSKTLMSLPAHPRATRSLPGPVIVGAARLLHKRMRRAGMFNEYGKPRLRLSLNELIAHAESAQWDDSEFWGWDPALRRRAEEEHGPNNDLFAEFVWGTTWPEPWSTGKTNRVDLADLKPAMLADVFATVDRLIDDLAKMRPPAPVADYEDQEELLPDDDEL